MTAPVLSAPYRANRGGLHPVEPSLTLTLILGLGTLVVGFVADYAAFRGALAVIAGSYGDVLVSVLAAAAGLIALGLMFEAGYKEAERREITHASQGKGIVRTLQGAWLLLGVAATLIRLSEKPNDASDIFGPSAALSGSSDPLTGPLGEPLASGSAGVDLGFVTIFPEHLPMTFFMFALYLAVGVGAYVFGGRSHNLLLSDVRRQRRSLKKKSKELSEIQRKHDEAFTKAARLRNAADATTSYRTEIAALSALESALSRHLETVDNTRALSVRRLEAEMTEARRQGLVEAINDQVLAETKLAEATGRAAEQQARTQLHRHLAEPARTVMDTDGALTNQPTLLED